MTINNITDLDDQYSEKTLLNASYAGGLCCHNIIICI